MRVIDDLTVTETPDETIDELRNQIWYLVSKKRNGKLEYFDCTCTLDIETTNTTEEGFLYTLQGTFHGVDFLYRYVEDFIKLLERLVEELSLNTFRRLVIHIHNFSYEHQYLTQILEKTFGVYQVLLVKKRKPLRIIFRNGIEFRDSLKLFQKSLARATEGMPHEKRKGDLDYTVYRTPDTYLSDNDYRYCVYDGRGLWEAIEELKQKHGYNAATLPLTNTSMVIDDMNRFIREDGNTYRAMEKLVMNKDLMFLAYKCMAGGDTHGTRWRSGKTFFNCNSVDLKSAHPSQMLLKKFPSGEPVKLPEDTSEFDLKMLIQNEHGWIARLFLYEFYIRSECPDPVISSSKCEELFECVGYDNGRVLGASGAVVYMDSNDYQRFQDAYQYKEVYVMEAWSFSLNYLPEKYRLGVLEKFKIKESMHDSPDYMFSKVCINTYFGACAQKTIREEYTLEFQELMEVESLKWEKHLEKSSEKEVVKSQKMKFPFLWGLWTSSLTRLDLWHVMKEVGWENCIYWDTDSVKYQGAKCEAVERYNEKIRKVCIERDAVVKNEKGNPVFIGVAEDEYPEVEYGYRKFRFLHAKCYAAEAYNKKTGSYEIVSTIAGVGKKEGAEALNGDIDNLKDGLYISDAGGMKLSYHDEPIHIITKFKRPTMAASWIYMEPREYLVNHEIPETLDELESEVLV